MLHMKQILRSFSIHQFVEYTYIKSVVQDPSLTRACCGVLLTRHYLRLLTRWDNSQYFCLWMFSPILSVAYQVCSVESLTHSPHKTLIEKSQLQMLHHRFKENKIIKRVSWVDIEQIKSVSCTENRNLEVYKLMLWTGAERFNARTHPQPILSLVSSKLNFASLQLYISNFNSRV